MIYGQICITVNRILTHERVHDNFVEALAAETRAIELGRGLDPGVAYGPVTNEAVISRVQSHIDDAVRKGATVIVGGNRVTKGHLSKGYFFNPTLLDNAALDSLPMREETYGPLAAQTSRLNLSAAGCVPIAAGTASVPRHKRPWPSSRPDREVAPARRTRASTRH